MRVEISDSRFQFDLEGYTQFLREQDFTPEQIDCLTILVGCFTPAECRMMRVPDPTPVSCPFGTLTTGCTFVINTRSQAVPPESISYELLELTEEYRQYLQFLLHMKDHRRAGDDSVIARAWDQCFNPERSYEFADFHLNTCNFFTRALPNKPTNV